eukprot:Skav210043  [mRNA]  locus=scaffold706:349554:356607:+ [translate_table: standard]
MLRHGRAVLMQSLRRRRLAGPSAGPVEQRPAIDFEKPEVGLCIAGGGLSAVCCATGTLRALEDLNVAKSITQLSPGAASAWATAAYVFSDASAVHLLGAGTKPEQLTLEALDALPVPLLRSVVSSSQAPF